MKSLNYRHLTTAGSILVALLVSGCATTPEHPVAQRINQDMVLVEGGSFTMGSDADYAKKAETPAREVTVNSFYISKFEVTQEIFESVMGSSMSYFPNPQVPVNNLSCNKPSISLNNSMNSPVKITVYQRKQNGSLLPKAGIKVRDISTVVPTT